MAGLDACTHRQTCSWRSHSAQLGLSDSSGRVDYSGTEIGRWLAWALSLVAKQLTDSSSTVI